MRHEIPEAALASHIAILGKTGSGKTYAAKGVVEHILGASGRVGSRPADTSKTCSARCARSRSSNIRRRGRSRARSG